MKHRYIVSYDVCDAKRLRRVYLTMRGFGRRIQYSVFRCDLSEMRRLEMIGVLTPLINTAEDQILIVKLGPTNGRSTNWIDSLGRAYTEEDDTPFVV